MLNFPPNNKIDNFLNQTTERYVTAGTLLRISNLTRDLRTFKFFGILDPK